MKCSNSQSLSNSSEMQQQPVLELQKFDKRKYPYLTGAVAWTPYLTESEINCKEWMKGWRYLVLLMIIKGKMMSRKTSHDIANKRNEMLGMISRPLYFVIFPISRNTSLASCTARTTDPTRANLPTKHGTSKLSLCISSRFSTERTSINHFCQHSSSTKKVTYLSTSSECSSLPNNLLSVP